jgi:hypothetical protein
MSENGVVVKCSPLLIIGRDTPRGRSFTMDDARRWADRFRAGSSFLEIAHSEGVDPGTVSKWLGRVGVEVRPGHHRVKQPELKIPELLVNALRRPAEEIIDEIQSRFYGFRATDKGLEQLRKYVEFIRLYREGKGVEETAAILGIHRSTVAEWRNGTDMPYTVKLLSHGRMPDKPGFQFLPLVISSGGNEVGQLIGVPKLPTFDGILEVLSQLTPTDRTYARCQLFGIEKSGVDSLRSDLFAYLLGFMLGDASKLGGQEERFTSVNLDLQLSMKQESNQRLGEFVCMCVNALGLQMERMADKQPTGSTRFGKHPSAAYRWASSRSPLLAWMFGCCLGLNWDENTSVHPVKMDWIIDAPRQFRMRFIQALADSDASVKHHQVIITSVPNSEFVSRILQSLGVLSAHPILEHGKPLRTYVSSREAAALPLFNEFVRGYRYEKLTKGLMR